MKHNLDRLYSHLEKYLSMVRCTLIDYARAHQPASGAFKYIKIIKLFLFYFKLLKLIFFKNKGYEKESLNFSASFFFYFKHGPIIKFYILLFINLRNPDQVISKKSCNKYFFHCHITVSCTFSLFLDNFYAFSQSAYRALKLHPPPPNFKID